MTSNTGQTIQIVSSTSLPDSNNTNPSAPQSTASSSSTNSETTEENLDSVVSLGDVWCNQFSSSSPTTTNASKAFAEGSIRSIDPEGNSAALQVVFRNETPDPLILCWADKSGIPHHFRTLPSAAQEQREDYVYTGAFGGGIVCQIQRPDCVDCSSGGDHLEHTYLGDAFVLARKATTTTEEEEEEDGKKITKRSLDSDDVVAGYRPMNVKSSCTHIISISRQHLSSSNPRYWKWTVSVEEEPASAALNDTPLDSTHKVYTPETLGGWSCRCEPGWDDHTTPAPTNNDNNDDEDEKDDNEAKHEQSVRERFTSDLIAAAKDLPPHALPLLRKSTTFWINKTHRYGTIRKPTLGRGMCYHPGEAWLIHNGENPNKVNGVELYNSGKYANDCTLWGPGGVILHELSHAWHCAHTPDGYSNVDVEECYKHAMEEGLYECVQVHGTQGPTCKAYACTNAMEYFAELSVAFLGGRKEDETEEHNKWFPFNRTQLRLHDPMAFDMMKRIWKVED